MERVALKHPDYPVGTARGKLLNSTGAQPGALRRPREAAWGCARAVPRQGMCVHLWLTHADVWQEPTQYCEAIILQLKKNTFIPKKPVSSTFRYLEDLYKKRLTSLSCLFFCCENVTKSHFYFCS